METDDQLAGLYRGIILEHNKAPHFFEKRPEARYVVEAFNPLCGDKFRLYLDIEHDVIARATFHGYGCAVSKASASVLMTKIQGLALADLPELLQRFLEAVAQGEPQSPAPALDPDTAAFAVARNFPGREQCATLAWDALLVRKLEIGN